MAILFDAPVEPDALTTYIREIPTPADFTFLNEMPTRTEDDNTVDWAEIVRTNRTARYRTYDGRIHVSVRDAGSEKRVKLPPLSSSLAMGELERLQLQFARTGGTNQRALAAAVYNDATALTNEVLARLEQAWGDVITDGKITLNEGGLAAAEADFGVPGNQLVAPGTLWSNVASATPLTDIVAWSDVYVANNGRKPKRMRTSQAVIRLMQRSAEVIAAIAGTNTGRTRVRQDELADLLESEGLPRLEPAYDAQVDVDGVSVRTVPEDRVAFLPEPAELGSTAWGVSATALELVDSNVSDFSFEEAPGIVGVVEKVGPPYRQFTYVDAVAMPFINGRLLMVADVK